MVVLDTCIWSLNATMLWVKCFFFIFSKFISKGQIELNATFGWSLDEILVLLRKPMKPRFVDEIIALMHEIFFFSFQNLLIFLYLWKVCIISASLMVDVCFMNQLKTSLLLICTCYLNSWRVHKKKKIQNIIKKLYILHQTIKGQQQQQQQQQQQ